MPAIYFLAGLIAGLAIAWYATKLHYEGRAPREGEKGSAKQSNPNESELSPFKEPEDENKKT